VKILSHDIVVNKLPELSVSGFFILKYQ
jgi:hypothetical protein